MKAVIFDMDGVLINTEPLHFACWKKALASEGIDLEYEVYKPCIGSTHGYLQELLRAAYGDQIQEMQDLKEKMFAEKAKIVEKEGFPKLPGAQETVKKLKELGYRLAVASSSPRHAIEQVLEALELSSLFDCIMSGEEVAHPKPAPDTFLGVMRKMGLQPEDCLVVEDSTNGGKAAAAAGMRCIWFHNPDSGDQSIPHAELELTSWLPEEAQKMFSWLEKVNE